MSGGLFGSTETSNSIPGWLEKPTKQMLEKSMALSEVGYMPWMGADVAALSPLQRAARESTARSAASLGMPTPTASGSNNDPMNVETVRINPMDYGQDAGKAKHIMDTYRNVLGRDPDQAGFDHWMSKYDPETFEQRFTGAISNPENIDPLTGMAAPQNFGGVSGYSSAPGFFAAKDALQQAQPGTMDQYNQFFVDPQTGEGGRYTFATNALNQQAAQQNMPQAPTYQGWEGTGDERGGNAMPQGQSQGGGFGISDLWDGGGLGASGGPFQGGGIFSDFANARAERKAREKANGGGGGLFEGWF